MARSRRSGNTVDIARATYTNSIGDPELSAVWRDPDFNANERAFYYARVLEIPTPRWTDFASLGVDASPKLPMSMRRARLHIADLVYA